MFLPDWAVDEPVVHFLHWWLMWNGQVHCGEWAWVLWKSRLSKSWRAGQSVAFLHGFCISSCSRLLPWVPDITSLDSGLQVAFGHSYLRQPGFRISCVDASGWVLLLGQKDVTLLFFTFYHLYSWQFSPWHCKNPGRCSSAVTAALCPP